VTTGALETSAFAFASDLADEGVETVLSNIQERAGLGGITPAFSYHAARDVFPHNPRRKVRLIDSGALYFPPDRALYGRLQPRVDTEALERDVLAETCRTASARGMRVDAWTIFLHADRRDENQDCVTVNAFGDRYPADLCPANPDVRVYARALVADVCRYDIGSIFAESLHYHPVEHGHEHERYLIELGTKARYLLGLCFCAHCLARATAAGVDGGASQAAVRDELERTFASRDAVVSGELERSMLADVGVGELGAYLDVRADTVTSLAAEAAEVADAAGKRFVFMDPSGAVKGYWTGKPEGGPAAEIGWRFGIDLPALAAVCPEVHVLAYAADVERVRLDLEAYRRVLADATISAVFRPIPPDCETAENLAAKLELARELGLTWAGIYHYGFLRLEALDLIRDALAA
jgi:hypothetical protein